MLHLKISEMNLNNGGEKNMPCGKGKGSKKNGGKKRN